MTKNSLIKKVLNAGKNFAKKLPIYAGLAVLPVIYSNNVNAQKPEEAQKFGTKMIGGKPAVVSLSEYFGTSYLSVKTDEKGDVLGREFYPFITLRGKNAEGKDTTNIVSWKSRAGMMEDLKSDVIYVPQKIDKKYLIQLKSTGESVLGIGVSEDKTTKEGDAITGKVIYESGKIEDVIRTVKFPDENGEYYLFYRDHSVDTSGVESAKKTPFLLVKACKDEPLYFSGKDVFFEGEVFELVARDNSNLKKIVDADGKSLIYSPEYLEQNKTEINVLRANDRAASDGSAKRGIPGHVKELKDGESCTPKSYTKEKTPSELKVNGRIKLGAGYTMPNGFVAEISPQVQLGQRVFFGPYASWSNSAKKLENITQEEGFRQAISVPAQMYFVSTGTQVKENTKITNDFGLGLNLSYTLSKNLETSVKAGLIGQKTKKIMDSSGEEYLEIGGVKDSSSVYSYNETNTSTAKAPLFKGSPAYAGAGMEYSPLKGKYLENLSVAGEFGYVFGNTKENSMPLGMIKINYTFKNSKTTKPEEKK